MTIARVLTMLAGFALGSVVWHTINELGERYWLDVKQWLKRHA